MGDLVVNDREPASLIRLHDGLALAKHLLDKPRISIGRDPGSDIVIDDKVVSMAHAEIEVIEGADPNEGKSYFIKDLDSTNSTFVNDRKIKRHQLANEDLIRVGWTTFKFMDVVGRKSDKTLKIHKSWIPGVYYTKE